MFDTIPTMTGFAVIDLTTGHTVDERPTLPEANGVRRHLNHVAKAGAKSLAVALGCGEGPVSHRASGGMYA